MSLPEIAVVPNLPIMPALSMMGGGRVGIGALIGGRPMILHGFIMSAELAENPPGSDRIEITLRLQGVGPGQPRRIIVPHDLLIADPSLDADDVVGRGFEAEVFEAGPSRWEATQLSPEKSM